MSDHTILIDSREKPGTAYTFDQWPVATNRTTLTTGDYSIDGFETEVTVERKAMDDLATCCGTDRDRFEAQVQRMSDMDNATVVIEGTKKQAQNGDYYPNIHPNSLVGTVESWSAQSPTGYGVEFVWAGTRDQAERFTYNELMGFI